MSLKILNPNTIGDPDKRKPGAASARSYVVAALSTALVDSGDIRYSPMVVPIGIV